MKNPNVTHATEFLKLAAYQRSYHKTSAAHRSYSAAKALMLRTLAERGYGVQSARALVAHAADAGRREAAERRREDAKRVQAYVQQFTEPLTTQPEQQVQRATPVPAVIRRYTLNAKDGDGAIRSGYEDVVNITDGTTEDEVIRSYIDWVDDPAVVATEEDVDVEIEIIRAEIEQLY